MVGCGHGQHGRWGGFGGGDWLDSFRNPACMGKLSQLMATGSDPSKFNISVLCDGGF